MQEQPAQTGATLTAGADERKSHTFQRQIQIRFLRHDDAVVAAQFQQAASQPRGHRLRHAAPHRHRAGGRHQCHLWMRCQYLAHVRAANDHTGQGFKWVHAAGFHRFLQQLLAGQRTQRRFLRRLPHQRIAAHQRQRRVPRPHRHGKIEGGDDADHTQRMPLLHHAMLGPLAGNGQPRKLARQTHGKIADVDQLLHLAQGFLHRLARFQHDETGQISFAFARNLAHHPHQFATPGSRQLAPVQKTMMRLAHQRIDLVGGRKADLRQTAAING